jgi:cyclopropane-fatty-acyl-phospholipid synthase
MRTWDGDRWGPGDAAATIVLNHPGALRALLLPPSDLTAGEAYVYDDIDIEGDIVAALTFGAEAAGALSHPRYALQLLRYVWDLPRESRRREAVRPRFDGRLHSRNRDRDALRHHYDTGNDFYSQFLGEEMVYSCGYFLAPDDPLDTAQARKLDLILRKLQLRPGQRFLDIGCGWGALVIRAARDYGVEATGVTLSSEQAEHGRRLVADLRLEGRVTIREMDYRDVAGRFDAIASIGMFEHVGPAQLPTYFAQLRRLLEPEGVLLNHGISDRRRGRPRVPRLRRRRPTFISTYVFPDGQLAHLDAAVVAAEQAGFEVRDAESLRASYALTLRRWVGNLERNHDAAVAAAGERAYRIWRIYMAGSVVAFEQGALSVYQLLCTKPPAPWSYGRSWALAADDD